MSALSKAELVDQLVIAHGFSKREAREVVEAFFEEMRDALVRNEAVKLSGFGNFELRDKSARPGRNPRTGEAKVVAARRVVTFHAGQKLRARVNGHAGPFEGV